MRAIVRALLVSMIVILIGFVAYSYWSGSALWRDSSDPANADGTSGAIDTQKARERGAQLGQKVAVAAQKVGDSVEEAAITSKIKAKMVLDDSVKARAIDVTTNGSVVTLTGTVHSRTEHDRAVALARETAGVTQVIDHLAVRPPA